MLHTATLVHDDIIDEADTRRGRPSSNTTWGNAKCVLAGDWLYMQAFSTALEERNFRVLDLLISLTQQMVEGELLQMEKLGHLINEEEYFDLIYRKTACLFKVSMQLGAAIRGRDLAIPETCETPLGEYGRNLGLAFQIVDDVLDLTAAEDVLGKPVASDLREGKATLAVIHALERGTGADREAIRTVLADRSFDPRLPRADPRDSAPPRLHRSTPWTPPAPTPRPPAQSIADLPDIRRQARPALGARLRHHPRPLKFSIQIDSGRADLLLVSFWLVVLHEVNGLHFAAAAAREHLDAPFGLFQLPLAGRGKAHAFFVQTDRSSSVRSPLSSLATTASSFNNDSSKAAILLPCSESNRFEPDRCP